MALKQDLRSILGNQRGVALMMIMTAIILLMAIYGEFTFESKIARLKATNILDKSQAKLLAESGLQLAITRLRLYKEAYNAVENNPSAKNMVPTQLLNQLWEVPFIYPIPVGKNASAAFKDTVNRFSKDTLLEGEMKVTIQNISNRMNLNLLRVDMTKYNPDPNASDGMDHYSQLNMSDQAIYQDVSVDQSLFFLLKRLVEDKREKDEDFDERYANLNYQELMTNLKYFMSDYQSLNQDPLATDAERDFEKIPLTPKYGPLGSSSELYAIPGWNDELIELIKNEFSVYPTTQIDFNKLTANMLRILIPNLTEESIKDFFIWRDDPDQPKFINSKADFKKYIVDQERLMADADFESRMKLFEQKGFTWGSNPNLFKVVSEGTFNRSVFTLVAYVLLPKNETTPVQGGVQAGTAAGTQGGTTNGSTAGVQGGAAGGTTGGTAAGTQGGGTAGTQSSQLLDPRIIEIQIN